MKTIQITISIRLDDWREYLAPLYAEEAMQLLKRFLPYLVKKLFIHDNNIFINTDYHIEEN